MKMRKFLSQIKLNSLIVKFLSEGKFYCVVAHILASLFRYYKCKVSILDTLYYLGEAHWPNG